MKNTIVLKIVLILQTSILLVYTIFAFQTDGANLFDIMIANIASLGWSGQFNLDFLCYLILSGLWIIWRNNYSLISIVFSILAATIGILFLAAYLIYLLTQEKGNLKRVLIGNR